MQSGLPEESLQQQLRHHRVTACVWAGVPAFAKRLDDDTRLAWWRRLLLGAVFGRWPARLPVPAGRRGLPFEVARLRELAAAGVPVPPVLWVADDYFVVASGGRSLETVLDAESDPARRLAWLRDAADDLGRFHAAGHWHGGAQVRNLVVGPRGFVRIDFDREFDRWFPLDILQALDLALWLASLQPYADVNTLHALVRRYAAHGNPAALARAREALRPLGVLARVVLLRWLAPKEMRRLATLATALE